MKIKNLKLNKFPSSVFCPPNAGFHGVALVAVLAILVVLTILAASFSAMMNLELKQSNEHQNSTQLDMLSKAGFEHAKTLLWTDKSLAEAQNSVSTIVQNFQNNSAKKNNSKPSFSKWFYVKNEAGITCGRYRIKIEDEAAKVNINRARLPKNSKGTGWDTGEINLPQALGLPPEIAKNVIKYRYGPNMLPGGRGDDDQNNVVLMADGIDNNANGVIDEEDEGLNDPGEYKADQLMGDDRKFSTINEVASILLNTKKKLSFFQKSKIRKEIPLRATIYSTDEPGSPTLQNKIPADINSITARECRKLIVKANANSPFEGNSAKRTQLATNIIDYRDENHVLSTLNSTYGVEAICFNEILANDESYSVDPSYAFAPWLNSDKDYWKDNCGSSDGERMFYLVDLLYNAVPDDPQHSYSIEPRKAWRVRNTGGDLGQFKILNNKIKLTFPKAIGKRGRKTEVTPFNDYNANTKLPVDLPGYSSQKPWCRWHKPTGIIGDKNQHEETHENMLNVLKKLGAANGERPDFPSDYFKGSQVMIYKWANDLNSDTDNKAIGCYNIIEGDESSIIFDTKEVNSENKPETENEFLELLEKAGMSAENYDLSVTINSWSPTYPIACVPKANRTYLLRSRRPVAGNYFKIYIGRPAYGRYTDGYPNKLGVSGRVGGSFADDKDLKRQWICNDNKPIRTRSDGWMKIMLTSSPTVTREDDNKQYLSYFRVAAPEVIEMYNASSTPISLANWRVICNTGSLATEIGRIRSSSCYDKKLRKSIIDNNPVVHPGGHFYLVSDTSLFDSWYGSGNGKWGGNTQEEVPVFQMDEENWGVTYKIKSTRMSYGEGPNGDRWGYVIGIDDKGLDKEIFNLETIKFVDKKNAKKDSSWNNIFAPVLSDWIYKKNTIFIRPLGDDNDIISGKLVNKSIMIIGLPHGGGVVSLTLKNEYDQICARTVDYGKVEVEDLNVSMEKVDPTKNTWIRRRKPSISGTDYKARNRAIRSRRNNKFFIKNGPFGSIGEVRNVSTGDDFERLGCGGNITKNKESLRALANVMCSSHVRLESCDGNVTRTGWRNASDEVKNSTKSTIACKNGSWKVDQWKGQTLRFLTGNLRGEKFPVISNSKNVIIIGDKKSSDITYSSPNRLSLKPEKGDKFSLGPGYASPFCFTRKSGDVGDWTWKNAVSRTSKCEHNLYIHGLNDAIDTTEFFEENNNSSIDVQVWNYKTKSFDKLKKRGKFGKMDSFNAGKISSDNISSDGDFRLQLTAHDVVERNTSEDTGKTIKGTGGKQTGFAWFNYAVITPVPISARVNINTAPARLLASLPGINPELAKNIASGKSNGKNNLKPYRGLGDIMRVKGMSAEIFEKCANLLTVDSSVFTVEVEAETLSPKRENPTDNITGSRTKRYIVKSKRTTDNSFTFKLLEKL